MCARRKHKRSHTAVDGKHTNISHLSERKQPLRGRARARLLAAVAHVTVVVADGRQRRAGKAANLKDHRPIFGN